MHTVYAHIPSNAYTIKGYNIHYVQKNILILLSKTDLQKTWISIAAHVLSGAPVNPVVNFKL